MNLDKTLKVSWIITAIIITCFVGVKIYKELRPQSLNERIMECLKLGSEQRYASCLQLLQTLKDRGELPK